MLARHRLLGLGLILLSLGACSRPAPPPAGEPAASATSSSTSLNVQSPWIRAVPPGASAAAAYALLRNDGDQALKLTQLDSDVAEHNMLHSMSMEGGVMQMRMLDALEIPAHGSVALAPGGLHLMLVGLKRELKPGDDVEIRLQLEGGQQLSVKFPVREAAP